MSEALRAVFLELGFDIDMEKLDALEKRVRDTVKTEKTAAKEHDKLQREKAKTDKDAAKESEKAAKEAADAAKKDAEAKTKAADDAKVAMAATTAAIALVARAALQAVNAFAAHAEELRDTSREARVTTTQLQELEHAAVQGGVGVERMRSGVNTFGQSLRAAERYGNSTTFLLRRLGIQARDAGGHIRPTGELLDEVAVAMEHIQSPTRRARVAVQLFGESGRRMLDVLHTGPGGIRALRDELAELGGGVTPEAVAASREYTQATERLGRAQDSLQSVLAVEVLPALGWVATLLARVGGAAARLTNGTHVARIALVLLGATGVAVAADLAAAWIVAAAPYLLIAAGVGLLVLALDDLITYVEGGDSVIGRFLGRQQTLREVQSLWLDLRQALDDVAAAAGWVNQKAGEAREGFQWLRADLWEGVSGAGAKAWVTIEKVFLAVWARVEGRVNALFGGVGQRLASVASRLGLDDIATRIGQMPSTVSDAASGASAGADRRLEGALGPRGTRLLRATSALNPFLDARYALGAYRRITGAEATVAAPTETAIPATRIVAAPGGRGGNHRTVVHRTTQNSFHIAGTDPHLVAAEAVRLIRAEDQHQRDAEHPRDDEEG